MPVLVADNDPGYADVISDLLRKQSHRVILARTAEALGRFVTQSTAQLFIVSRGLVEMPAAELVHEIRRHQAARILLIFDEDAKPHEIADCLEAGAEDCIRKPFHPSVFAARVEAITRRMRAVEPLEADVARDAVPSTGTVLPGETVEPFGAPEFQDHGVDFDEEHRRVFYNGNDLWCSEVEYQILETMARMDGQVVPYAFFNAQVWGYRNMSDGALLQGHVSSIRRKLRNAGFSRSGIRTIHGVGYALSA